jgi:uncharacterized membrane protein (UPF0127 family)
MIREIIAESGHQVIDVQGHPLRVELARTQDEQELGLMHRTSLPDDAGMLFCYDSDQQLSFWMRGTSIPLSIAFISADGVISQISDLEPYDERAVTCPTPCRWALEVNRGWFDKNSVNVGNVVSFR